jgi:hypothetical protein
MGKHLLKIAGIFGFMLLSIGSGTTSSNSSSSNSPYGRFAECNINTTGALKADMKVCDTQTKLRIEQSQCLSRAFKKYSDSVCSPSMQISAGGISFMYTQLAQIDDPRNFNNSTASQRDQRYRALDQLIDQEQVASVRRGIREGDEIMAEIVQARANANIDRSIAILGGMVKRQDTNNFTYIINGKFVNCTTFGSMTNCN